MANRESEYAFIPRIENDSSEYINPHHVITTINISEDPNGILCIKDIDIETGTDINIQKENTELIGYFKSKTGNRVHFYENRQEYSPADIRYYEYFDEDSIKNYAWELLLIKYGLELLYEGNNGWDQLNEDCKSSLLN